MEQLRCIHQELLPWSSSVVENMMLTETGNRQALVRSERWLYTTIQTENDPSWAKRSMLSFASRRPWCLVSIFVTSVFTLTNKKLTLEIKSWLSRKLLHRIPPHLMLASSFVSFVPYHSGPTTFFIVPESFTRFAIVATFWKLVMEQQYLV